jgi:hypothetical protein
MLSTDKNGRDNIQLLYFRIASQTPTKQEPFAKQAIFNSGLKIDSHYFPNTARAYFGRSPLPGIIALSWSSSCLSRCWR